MSNSLLEYATEHTRNSIISTFFGEGSGSSTPNLDAAYFEYYERELKRVRIGVSKSSWAVNSLAIRTHADVLHICDILSSNRDPHKKDVVDKVKAEFPAAQDDLSINRSIDLTIRLFLMLNTRDDQLSLLTPQKTSIQWDSESSAAFPRQRNNHHFEHALSAVRFRNTATA